MPLKRRRGGIERRRKPRTDARLSMRVEGVPSDGQPAQIVTETQNISASGVYCRSSHYLSPCSKVGLTIVLPRMPRVRPKNELVKCEGIVVRCEPSSQKRGDRGFLLACAFSELESRHREMLEEFVTWRNLQSLRAAAAAAQGGGTRRPAAARTHPRAAIRAAGARRTARGRRGSAPRRRSAR
jgi:c-di-GMP-binding flagellar brake protein YcgR